MIDSPITRMLGISYPVFQGGMAWVADSSLASAVSNAGGLGIIAAGNAPSDVVKEEIRKAKCLTERPFGVNIMLMSPYADDIASLVIEEGVKVVTTGAGNPNKYMKAWKDAGITVIPVVASASLAKLMERVGADALIAEGTESGGHVGELTTLVLVPQIVDAVKIPVIAAGGIADGRAAAAMSLLGACGVQMGTRFLVATECNIHPVYKEKIIKAGERCTMVTGRKLGHPVRSLKTDFPRRYEKAEYAGLPDDELEEMAVGTLRKAVKDGDLTDGCFLSGQAAALVNKEESAEEIILDVVKLWEETLEGAKKWVR